MEPAFDMPVIAMGASAGGRDALERFFVHRAGSYVVRNEVRVHMIFARLNLVEDPPFTRMDLVSCRNMLIYLQPRSQDAAVSRLHYALAPGGVLFMGPSETPGPIAGGLLDPLRQAQAESRGVPRPRGNRQRRAELRRVAPRRCVGRGDDSC